MAVAVFRTIRKTLPLLSFSQRNKSKTSIIRMSSCQSCQPKTLNDVSAVPKATEAKNQAKKPELCAGETCVKHRQRQVDILMTTLTGTNYSQERSKPTVFPLDTKQESKERSTELKENTEQAKQDRMQSAHPGPSFYRRQLPSPPCIAFSSSQGKRLFRGAMENGYAENFFVLAEQFRTQDEPTFCGLTTVTMVLNTLGVDPGRVWKGPWRWFHETMLDCCEPIEVLVVK